MDTVSSIYLGIVQGLTEFLPISSSGHLVLFQNLLGFKEPELLLDCSLHVGTLMAVLIYFSSDLKRMILEARDLSFGRRKPKETNGTTDGGLLIWILVGSLPTAVIGLVFRSSLESLFGSVTAVGVMLVFTGAALAITRLIPEGYNQRREVGLWTALAVGTVQGMALIPGVSRSGITIVCGILFKLKGDLAARFSFLLSIPAIVGASGLQLFLKGLDHVDPVPLITGLVSSALVGLIALRILMGVVRKGNLFYFSPYCWTLGLAIILVGLLH